jgi:large subunit ribosomal protein L10
MSKHIKQMEMEALKRTFQDIRDMVLLTSSGVDAQVNHHIRQQLRKKNIRLQVVKNSLARRVFDDLGIQLPKVWEKPTLVAWGAGSVAELSREIEGLIKKNDKIQVKTAVAEGQALTFAQALRMPTRAEAIGRVIGLAQSPAARLVGQILGPAGRVAGQIKTLRERPAAGEEPAAAVAAG